MSLQSLLFLYLAATIGFAFGGLVAFDVSGEVYGKPPKLLAREIVTTIIYAFAWPIFIIQYLFWRRKL